MTTIYLSSTYEDLKEYREVVYKALRKGGYNVIAMEDYVATDQRPVDKCLKDVRGVDIYVGIFAFRYGYIPPETHGNPNKLSITELEFRHAETLKKPCLTFVVNESKAWPPMFDDARKAEDKGDRINRLRQYLLTEKMGSSFSEPYELASLVQAAVAKHLNDSKPPPVTPEAKEASAPVTWDIEKDGSPYPGLMHFTPKYAPVFFGREAEVGEILDRMHHSEGRFIIVSGGSGTGKSSLVDAGVLPRVKESGLPEMAKCVCKRMVPSQGSHPFDALMRVLHSEAEQAGIDSYESGQRLLSKPGSFSELLKTIISKDTSLVLFLDQMEELFTAQTKDHAKPFLSALYGAVTEASFRVIATIRSDFLHHCHEHEDMLKVLNGPGHYCLGRVEPFMMHDMIVKPAACAELTVPDRLVRRLVQDTGSEPGNLPLLAFVLQRLFDKRSGNVLSEAVYDTLGGVAGAISDHIKTVEEEAIAKKIEGGGALDLLPRIFHSLLVVNEEGRPTRRRVPISKFSKDVRAIVDVLVTERLLSSEGEGETATVSLAHEKLFQAWPALKKWIDENQNDLFVLWRAENQAREWQKHGFGLEDLWPVDRLKQLQAIVQDLSDRNVDPLVTSYASPQEKLLKHLEGSLVSHQDRLTIGNYLAALSDRRRGVALTPDGIPDIDWVDISEGTVALANVPGSFPVKFFRIARYPVTNIQFEAFVKAKDGYSTDYWWDGIERHQAPFSPQWTAENYPCQTVSWYEAVAFCRWLTQKYREKDLLTADQEIQLPTEWEWQLATTGGDATREYPWEGRWDPARCNSGESGLNRATAVGLYPNGATLQGVLDMAGNVLEWCLNKYDKPGDRSSTVIDKSRDRRAQRGGSWNYGPGRLQSSFRDGDYPGFGTIGFRLAQKNPTAWNGAETLPGVVDIETPKPVAETDADKVVAMLIEQVSELKIMEAVRSSKPAEPNEPQSVTELASLEGHWVNAESGTHAYAKVINGELVAPYWYEDNHKLTGVYFGWRKTGEYWFGRFKSLENEISGFSLLKQESVDLLSGAWWSAEEGKDVPDAPPKGSGVQATWKREKDGEPQPWALQFFEEVRRQGLASRLGRE
jgi:hypothetical protein